MKNNIDVYRKELKDYVYTHIKNATFDEWHFKYLQERLNAEVLRDRLRRCKHDNNQLKKQYTDVIDFLLKPTNRNHTVRSVADICGKSDMLASNLILQMLLKYKKCNYATPSNIFEKHTHISEDADGASHDEWKTVLDKIILAFAIQAYTNIYERSEEDVDNLREGMKLFIEYIDSIYI